MDFIRKAFNRIPRFQFQKDSFYSEPWESESDPYCKDIRRWGYVLTGEGAPSEAIEEALRHMGHVTYAGGPEVVSCITKNYLPHILAVLREEKATLTLRNQVLKTVALICHRNKKGQEVLRSDHHSLQLISEIIGEVTEVRSCRWACYLLLVAMVDNVLLMRDLKNIDGLCANLEMAADFPRSWIVWGTNLADLLLKLLGWRDPLLMPAIM